MIKYALSVACMALVGFAANAESITVHGSTTVNANLFEPFQAELQTTTGDAYTVVANGSSRGIEGLNSGAAQIGMISSELPSVLSKMKLADKAGDYTAVKIGDSKLVPVVHSSNAVTKLSKEQVQGIFKGTITNWKDVGGADQPIVVVTEYKNGGMRTEVEKHLLSKESMSAPGMKEMPNGSQVIKVASQLPTSFAMVPQVVAKSGGAKILESDAAIEQPLFLVAKGAGDEHFTKLVDAAKAKLK